MSSEAETYAVEILQHMLEPLNDDGECDLIVYHDTEKTDQEKFVELLKIVLVNAIMYRHPYVLGLVSWYPIDNNALNPRFCLAPAEVCKFDDLSEAEQVTALYILAKILLYLKQYNLQHGHLDHSELIYKSGGKLKIRLAFWGDEKDDWTSFQMLLNQIPALKDKTIGSIEDVCPVIEQTFPIDMDDIRDSCNDFGTGASHDFLTVEFLYKLAQPGREKWERLRALVKFAGQEVREIYLLLGFLYREGIGFEKDISMAISYFEKAKVKDIPAMFDLSDPMVAGALDEWRQKYNLAIESYKKCKTLLGIAHLGALLLRMNPDDANSVGMKILSDERMRNCAFAKRTLGDYFARCQQWQDAAEQYRMAAEAGDPDSKFSEGVMCKFLDREEDAGKCFREAEEYFADDRVKYLLHE